MKEYEFHPIANAFPLITGDEFKDFADARQPVTCKGAAP